MVRWSSSRHMQLRGKVQADASTKKLLQRIHKGAIAVIAHDDLDDLAVEGLIKANVKAVVNAGRTMTGTIASRSVLQLLDEGIPVFEIDRQQFDLFEDQMKIIITANGITLPSDWIPCTPFLRDDWLQKYRIARMNETMQLSDFIDNTLYYAEKEKAFMLEPIRRLPLRNSLAGKHVVIVVRGSGYKSDLACLRSYIAAAEPILVGVDGGADALMEQGYMPHLIIGDMDSVSDRALKSGAELIVHAYRDGTAPGLARVEKLGLKAELVSGGGTSEDLALLVAYDHHCELMVTVGLHSHMQDFLAKERSGMGSTWLVRMKVGNRLIDARGISRLYPFILNADRRNVLRGWSAGVSMAKSILSLCCPFTAHRKEPDVYGAAGVNHHSRLE